LSPANCVHIRALHERILLADQERSRLQEVLLLFNEKTKGLTGFFGDHQSPIRFYSISDLTILKEIAQDLKSQDIDARLILSPTVPIGKERIRICLHAHNSKHDIDLLVRNFQKTYISGTN